MIYTSYYGNVKKLREAGVLPISISRYPAKFANVTVELKMLAPTSDMLRMEEEPYIVKFKSILGRLDPDKILKQINLLANGRDCALLCYERPDEFCHRHLVAEWLNSNTGTEIKEFGQSPTTPTATVTPPTAKQEKLF
jgi:hypothetical protein